MYKAYFFPFFPKKKKHAWSQIRIVEVMGSNPVQDCILFKLYFHSCFSCYHLLEYYELTAWPALSCFCSIGKALHRYRRGPSVRFLLFDANNISVRSCACVKSALSLIMFFGPRLKWNQTQIIHPLRATLGLFGSSKKMPRTKQWTTFWIHQPNQ